MQEPTFDELTRAARIHGGRLVSVESAEPERPPTWECARGHRFEATAVDVLERSSFCPHCPSSDLGSSEAEVERCASAPRPIRDELEPTEGDEEASVEHLGAGSATRFNSTQWKLMYAGLRLYSEEGVGHIALRRIALAAQQRNKDAIKYHFGDEDGLIQAIIEWQVTELNGACRELLAEDEEIRLTDPLRHTLRAASTPFVDLLWKPGPKLQFAHVAADICSNWGVQELIQPDASWTASLREAEMRVATLVEAPRSEEPYSRLNFVWATIVAFTSQTAIDLSGVTGRHRRERVKELRRLIVDWLAGALVGHSTARVRASEWPTGNAAMTATPGTTEGA
jgi:AcrR family transcriptional regulator